MRTLILALLSLTLFLAGCDARAADKEDIIAVMDLLDTCNDHSDGKGVLEVFTESSFKANERLLKVILDGTPEEVKALPLFERMEVLRARLLATRAQLAKLDGRGYAEFGTGRGWYITPADQRGVKRSLIRFRFNKAGTEAWASVTWGRERTLTRLHFIKERGAWRYDEAEAMIAYSAELRREARDIGISDDEYILEELEQQIRKEIPDSVWQPMP